MTAKRIDPKLFANMDDDELNSLLSYGDQKIQSMTKIDQPYLMELINQEKAAAAKKKMLEEKQVQEFKEAAKLKRAIAVSKPTIVDENLVSNSKRLPANIIVKKRKLSSNETLEADEGQNSKLSNTSIDANELIPSQVNDSRKAGGVSISLGLCDYSSSEDEN